MTDPRKADGRRPVFAIVRLDGDAKSFEHDYAVKGVYDEREVAEREAERLRELASQSSYSVVATRYFHSTERPTPSEAPQSTTIRIPDDDVISSAIATLKAAHELTLGTGRPATSASLLGIVAELLVARRMGAVPAPSGVPCDLVIGDLRIEVKAAVIRPGRRSPTLSFHSLDFHQLALVQFDEELAPIGMFIFAVPEIKEHVKGTRHQMILRITPEFLRRYGHSLL